MDFVVPNLRVVRGGKISSVAKETVGVQLPFSAVCGIRTRMFVPSYLMNPYEFAGIYAEVGSAEPSHVLSVFAPIASMFMVAVVDVETVPNLTRNRMSVE